MDKNIKFVLIIVASIFIGLSTYALLEQFLYFKQVESITVNMTKGLAESSDQSRTGMQVARQEQQKTPGAASSGAIASSTSADGKDQPD